jgi:hypothetical protein
LTSAVWLRGRIKRSPESTKIFAGLARVAAWEEHMRAVGHGRRDEMSAEDALAVAAKASPQTAAEDDPGDPNGRRVGGQGRRRP